MTEKQAERDNANTKRQSAYLKRLADKGGAPVRTDFNKGDLMMLDALVAQGVGKSRAEVIRVLIRSAYSKVEEK